MRSTFSWRPFSWRRISIGHFFLAVAVWLLHDLDRSRGALQLDQSHVLTQSVGGLITVTQFTPAQVFQVGQEGLLSQIDLQIRRDNGATSDAALEIWATSGGAPTGASPLYTKAIPNAQIPALPNVSTVPLTSVDVSAGGLQVSPGQQYMIALRSFGTFDDPDTSWAWGYPAYAGGDPYSTAFGGPWELEADDVDFAFRTWVDVVSEGLINGDFQTGSLSPWAPFNTPNGNTTVGYPHVATFDVNRDGMATPAAKIRVGSNTPSSQTPEGGGILQQFNLSNGGDFKLSVDIAVALEQDFGNTGPGKFDLLFDDIIVASVDYNGTDQP